ncbi:MAG: 50S ribosomal protein L18 [Gammaproteobacteria bacterium RIFCSPHIGHO2_12_FULL_45_9]|nr:MAG: 50S ribosomal protein L18 [Gammaproteobacteria bacterium RIFCSPHIGHO2_12_FULL_45_9]
MDTKKQNRLRRARRARGTINRLCMVRLSVHRTPQHTYAQLISPAGQVLASASTVESALRTELKHGGNQEAAKRIGRLVAERALALNVTTVAFDRSGFQYHGRVKALAEAAREAGLQF